MIHLYCLAVQAGFYSDVVEGSTIDRWVPGSILSRGIKVLLRVRDIYYNRVFRKYANNVNIQRCCNCVPRM